MRRILRWLGFGLLFVALLGAAGLGLAWRYEPELLGLTPPPPVVRYGIVWSDVETASFVRGAELARAEVNEAGGLLGRDLVFDIVDLEGDDSAAHASTVARRLARAGDLVAVIGHRDHRSAVTASVTYEEESVVYVNASITEQLVNKFAFRHVFSTVPDNARIGSQIATYAEGIGLRRIGLLTSRDDWAFETADAFLQQSVTLGIEVPARRSFFGRRSLFLDLIAEFAATDFDAILIIAEPETAARIIRQAAEMKLQVDMLLGTLADPTALAAEIGTQARPVTVPLLYNPNALRREVAEFRQRYEETYGEPPDGDAAQAYDAVKMLSDTIAATGSLEPLSIATILRYSLTWRGITGRHSFDLTGRVYTKPVGFATISGGEVSYGTGFN